MLRTVVRALISALRSCKPVLREKFVAAPSGVCSPSGSGSHVADAASTAGERAFHDSVAGIGAAVLPAGHDGVGVGEDVRLPGGCRLRPRVGHRAGSRWRRVGHGEGPLSSPSRDRSRPARRDPIPPKFSALSGKLSALELSGWTGTSDRRIRLSRPPDKSSSAKRMRLSGCTTISVW
jgi:hypothetical protein